MRTGSPSPPSPAGEMSTPVPESAEGPTAATVGPRNTLRTRSSSVSSTVPVPVSAGVKRPRVPVAPLPNPDGRRRGLAGEVRRLATVGRLDPEQVVVAEADLARRMRELASDLEAARCRR